MRPQVAGEQAKHPRRSQAQRPSESESLPMNMQSDYCDRPEVRETKPLLPLWVKPMEAARELEDHSDPEVPSPTSILPHQTFTKCKHQEKERDFEPDLYALHDMTYYGFFNTW